MLPIVPIFAMESETASRLGAVGRGPVGDALQALTTREAIATTTKVRWRRGMGDSGRWTNS